MTLYNCQKPKTSKKDKFLLKITSVGKPLSGNIFKAFSFKMKYISTTLKKKNFYSTIWEENQIFKEIHTGNSNAREKKRQYKPCKFSWIEKS